MAEAASTHVGHGPTLRIDKYLWFVRLAPTRSAAQALCERGVIRVNGRRIERAHSAVRAGDLITLPQGDRIKVVRIAGLPVRRGGASEAVAFYEEIVPGDV